MIDDKELLKKRIREKYNIEPSDDFIQGFIFGFNSALLTPMPEKPKNMLLEKERLEKEKSKNTCIVCKKIFQAGMNQFSCNRYDCPRGEIYDRNTDIDMKEKGYERY